MERSKNNMTNEAEEMPRTLNIKMTEDSNPEVSSSTSVTAQGQQSSSAESEQNRTTTASAKNKENAIRPKLQLTFNTFTVKSGEDLKIEILVVGDPAPKIEWKKEGQAVKETSRLEILNKASLTLLHIRHGVREHSGQYSVTASNSAGKDTTTITVVVLEKPDPPIGPVRIDEVNCDYVIMSWDPPSYTGGCQLENYVVEKRETTSTEWHTVSATTVRTTIKVTKLKTGNEYQFRISAENRDNRLGDQPRSVTFQACVAT
ncbi:titin-like isoform X2 [Xiphophorus maculatus]|uniref:titin-like isoform X2 n=1 Tax=Xiphophorus maculatus TaxID=8083 RepID=UPI000C6D1450|nr:titin-like isoform X2 [Xiphophorus maculatus]